MKEIKEQMQQAGWPRQRWTQGRKLLILSLAVAWWVALSGGALAVVSTDLKASQTSSGQTRLIWTFNTGDVIEYSQDGITWTNVANVGGPDIAGGDAVDGDTVIVNLTDYSNYYFRINNAGAYSNVVDAFPPNEHAHQYFSSNTDVCKNCHDTHEAVGPKLLKTATVNDTCKTCHIGTGSKYQINNGTVDKDGVGGTMPSLAGPFGNILGTTGATYDPESRHTIGAIVNTAPGGNPSGSSGGWEEPLGCGSCHTAHGDPAYQYRLLKKTLPYMGTETELPVVAYAKTGASSEIAYYAAQDANNKGFNTWCRGCHTDYMAGTGSGSTPGGVFNSTYYRHAVGVNPGSYSKGALNTTLPLEGVLADGTSQSNYPIVCLTCHKVHGSTALTNDTTDTLNDGGSNLDNNLLRLDYRGVCENCHKK